MDSMGTALVNTTLPSETSVQTDLFSVMLFGVEVNYG
jgi:hypothetical protein